MNELWVHLAIIISCLIAGSTAFGYLAGKYDSMRKQSKEIEELKDKIADLRVEIASLKGKNDTRNKMKKSVSTKYRVKESYSEVRTELPCLFL